MVSDLGDFWISVDVAGYTVGFLTSSLYNNVTDKWKFGKDKKTLSEITSDGIKNTIDWAIELSK